MARTKIPDDVKERVLLKSKRRCCLCYAEHGNSEPQMGQFAHLSSNREDSSEENLVYVCLNHHYKIDAGDRQVRYAPAEIKAARDQMYDALESTTAEHSDTPHSDYREFEQRVQALLASQFSNAGEDTQIIANAQIRGKSGHNHEFDATVKFRVAGISMLIVVETKYAKRPIGPDIVLQLAAKMRDVGAHKGIVITNSAFALGAKHVAQASGVALVTLGEDAGLVTILD